jgi:uncharacterized protein YaiI (UPF0178 family)
MTDPEPETSPIRLLVDADACPVREECVKVALRHGIKVTFVSNSYFRIETDPLVEREIVPGNFDAADDRIVEHVTKRAVVVTADILLAERCLKADAAAVMSHTGKPFTHDFHRHGRGDTIDHGGPQSRRCTGGRARRHFPRQDRSRFLSALDLALVRLKRHG